MKNIERIRAMNAEEMADFFFESPEIEFGLCGLCEYFGGVGSPEYCKTSHGVCKIEARNKAFKKWLQMEAKEPVARADVYKKIIAMFRPHDGEFLGFKGEEVIQGPNDRAMFGFDTNFPLEWLVEDYGFTEEEARWFISEVHRLHAEKEEGEG